MVTLQFSSCEYTHPENVIIYSYLPCLLMIKVYALNSYFMFGILLVMVSINMKSNWCFLLFRPYTIPHNWYMKWFVWIAFCTFKGKFSLSKLFFFSFYFLCENKSNVCCMQLNSIACISFSNAFVWGNLIPADIYVVDYNFCLNDNRCKILCVAGFYVTFFLKKKKKTNWMGKVISLLFWLPSNFEIPILALSIGFKLSHLACVFPYALWFVCISVSECTTKNSWNQNNSMKFEFEFKSKEMEFSGK